MSRRKTQEEEEEEENKKNQSPSSDTMSPVCVFLFHLHPFLVLTVDFLAATDPLHL